MTWQVLLSLLVGILTCLLLRTLAVDLWLGFGVLAFWANFIPNVGALIAVSAPMPVPASPAPTPERGRYTPLPGHTLSHSLTPPSPPPVMTWRDDVA